MLQKKRFYCSFFICGLILRHLFLPGLSVWAQEPQDTVKTHLLKEVDVPGSSDPSAYRATSPLQVLKDGDWTKINALQVSDAVKFFSGVQLKDYGGVGGLKTVSIRNLGANYTNVTYDGIAMPDYQTGQTDLSRFPLDNVEMITFLIGESDRILQTAQVQALAGTLDILIRPFSPEDGKKNKLKASLKAGSFGLLNPSLIFGKTINPDFSANVSADYLRTDGNYPFRQTIGYADSYAVTKKRDNSDVETLKLEANLNGRFDNQGRLHLKAYYYDSRRGLPGPDIYYVTHSRGERLNDRNFFAQIRYTQPVGEKLDFLVSARFNRTFTDYTNPELAGRMAESIYHQAGYYLNATFRYRFSERFSVSWANDGDYGRFNSNQANNVSPSRLSWWSVWAAKYETAAFNLTAKLLNTKINNRTETGTATADYDCLSPYIGFSAALFRKIPVRLRGFYKNTFRMPTFGDLYYSTVTNTNLKPEKARQYNLGLTWTTAAGKWFPFISLSGDVYRYRINDKIVAIPTANMFIWSVRNYSKVTIRGADLSLNMRIQTGPKFRWRLNGAYTFQNALNKTETQPAAYNKRLPYTTRHSASGYIGLETPWIDFNYNLLYSGKRYDSESNSPETQMKPFAEHGFSLQKTAAWKNTRFTFTAECLNLFDVQYQVVRSYPLPGRSFRLGIKIETK
ncbi:MAG: TonB-dependent receptor [Candidatus Symbiothrix sp.]|jgi:outer membrane cobalamin receptor|nr:TonB-dependent receptor [Candidatus Symbiothrix sp.]